MASRVCVALSRIETNSSGKLRSTDLDFDHTHPSSLLNEISTRLYVNKIISIKTNKCGIDKATIRSCYS
jgi:hypothetical protein